MRVAFQLEGAEDLAKRLTELGPRVERKAARPAVRSAQKVCLNASRASARSVARGTGRLFARGENDVSMSELIAQNLEIKAPRRQVAKSYSLHVQLRRDVPEFVHTSKTGRRTFIPAAIEYGHGSTPELAARPYMRAAAIATVQERMRVLGKELGAGILREAIIGRLK